MKTYPNRMNWSRFFRYLLEEYVDDFVSLVILASHEQLRHVSTGTMTGIHDVFPANEIDSNDPISEKKLEQLDREYSTKKTILGFDVDGVHKTIWLEEAKRAHLLTVLHGWICSSKSGVTGITLKEFESVVAKIRHAFTAIPAGRGLLTPCNKILKSNPPLVYLQRNIASIHRLVVLFVVLPQGVRDLHGTASENRCSFLVDEDDALRLLGGKRRHRNGR